MAYKRRSRAEEEEPSLIFKRTVICEPPKSKNITYKQARILNGLLSATIKDFKAKKVKMPYSNVMLGIDEGVCESFKTPSSRTVFTVPASMSPRLAKDGKILKRIRFAEINLSYPLWTDMLSNKEQRKKYWEGLKLALGHELFHAQQVFKGQTLYTEVLQIIQSKIKNLRNDIVELEEKKPKNYESMIAIKKSEIDKNAKMRADLRESDIYNKYISRIERKVDSKLFKIYGPKAEAQLELMSREIMTKQFRNTKTDNSLLYNNNYKSITSHDLANQEIKLATLKAARLFKSKEKSIRFLENELSKENGIVDHFLNFLDLSKGIKTSKNEETLINKLRMLKETKSPELVKEVAEDWYNDCTLLNSNITPPKKAKRFRRVTTGLTLGALAMSIMLPNDIIGITGKVTAGAAMGVNIGSALKRREKEKLLERDIEKNKYILEYLEKEEQK